MANNHNLSFWIGSILKVLLILFLIFDSVIKIIKHQQAIDGSIKLGVPIEKIPLLGIMLLVFTILYAIPATSTFGLVLITTYLGGATATMMFANQQGHPYIFPIVFGVLLWISQFLLVPTIKLFLFKFSDL